MTDTKVFKGSVRMAKATEKDMDAGYFLMNVLDDLDRGYYPELYDERSPDAPTFFDEDDVEHLQHLRGLLSKILDKAPGFMGRIMGGMSCFLNPANAVVDPEADTIEFHPGLRRHVQWSPFDPDKMTEGPWWVWTGCGVPDEWEWRDGAWHYLGRGGPIFGGSTQADVSALMVHPFFGPPDPPTSAG